MNWILILYANALAKGMNPSTFLKAKGKIVGKAGFLSLHRTTILEEGKL